MKDPKYILKQWIKRHESICRLCRRLACNVESLVWGNTLRESILLKLLEEHYASKCRRDWQWSAGRPHFFNQRIAAFETFYGKHRVGPYPLFRSFFSAEVVRDGDRLLDIGCGDGFYAERFFSPRCSHVDAIDIEPAAIGTAVQKHRSPNVNFVLMDAATQPFPHDTYDVVVWDSALGHFPAGQTECMLRKIACSLAPDGVFAGSESLGKEGADHLQFFDSLDQLHQLFQPRFKFIQLRTLKYPLIHATGVVRTEAFWRCSNSRKRLDEIGWRTYTAEKQNYER